MRLRSLIRLLALGVLACSAPFSEEEHGEGPPAATVRFVLEVSYPPGSTADPDGFLAIGPGFSQPVELFGGVIYSPGIPAGTHTVRVGSVGEWCTLSPTQRTLTILPGDTVDATFQISCGTLYRPGRVIYRQEGIRPDTAPVSVNVAGFPVVDMYPDDTLRRMIAVGRTVVSVPVHAGCRRLPSDSLNFDMPYFPADTVNYVITMNCGVVRALGTLNNGDTPASLIELAGDSSYWIALGNALPDAIRARGSPNGGLIARGRQRLNGGDTEWAISVGGSTPSEVLVRPWGTTFASYPVWRRDQSRIDYLVQDTTGITIWSAAPIAGGGTPVQLALPGTLAPGSPDWSPDGTRLAYVVQGGIAIAPPGAGVADQVLTPTSSLTLTDPRWLPGGDTLIVVGALDTAGGARNAIWRMDVATGTMTQLTSPPAGESDGSVAVSSDGRHIAFFRRTIALGDDDPAPRLRIRSLIDGTEWQLPVAGTLQADPIWVP